MTNKHQGWQPIRSAPANVEKCFLWCSDDILDEKTREKRPYGLAIGSISEGYASGRGLGGNWTFTHYADMLAPPEQEGGL